MVLERLIYTRLYNFPTVNKMASNHQYGFRENSSTCMALINLLDKISNNIDEKNYTGIFNYLSKACDTIDHTILLNKLYCYGKMGVNYDWFKNKYLNGRKQYVHFRNTISSPPTVTFGVPHGSITLYSVYK